MCLYSFPVLLTKCRNISRLLHGSDLIMAPLNFLLQFTNRKYVLEVASLNDIQLCLLWGTIKVWYVALTQTMQKISVVKINPQATNVIYIYGAPILNVSRSHTTTHHSRQDSSGRVISSSQRPLPDNTRHSQQINIHAPCGIRTHDLSR